MNKKVITTLALALTVTTLTTGAFSNVKAATINNEINNVSVNGKIKDVGQAIKLIEQHYLVVNENGTSQIKSEANKYIDSSVLNEIKVGTNKVNECISSGVLVRDKKTNVIREAKIKYGFHVDGSYIWHWYGFDFVMNARNAGIFAAGMGEISGKLAGGAAIGGAIPGVSFVLGASAALISVWSSRASAGNSNGRGCIAYFMGDPSWAQLYNVTTR